MTPVISRTRTAICSWSSCTSAAKQRPFATRWLPQLQAGGVQLQVCALFSDDVDLPELALRKALLGVGEFDRAVAENPERVAVRSAADLDAALEPGRTRARCSRSRAWSRSATTPA